MNKINIAINGFGRIGRLVFRAAINNPNINIVGINEDSLSMYSKLEKVPDELVFSYLIFKYQINLLVLPFWFGKCHSPN